MKFYGIKALGKMILEKLPSIPTFSQSDHEGRIFYDDNNNAVVFGDNAAFRTLLKDSNNLSDVSSASTARTNLGLGTAATKDYSNSETGDTVAYRDASGRMKATDPSAAQDVATKNYVDSSGQMGLMTRYNAYTGSFTLPNLTYAWQNLTSATETYNSNSPVTYSGGTFTFPTGYIYEIQERGYNNQVTGVFVTKDSELSSPYVQLISGTVADSKTYTIQGRSILMGRQDYQYLSGINWDNGNGWSTYGGGFLFRVTSEAQIRLVTLVRRIKTASGVRNFNAYVDLTIKSWPA